MHGTLPLEKGKNRKDLGNGQLLFAKLANQVIVVGHQDDDFFVSVVGFCGGVRLFLVQVSRRFLRQK
jgi:hypothetical protein